MTKSIPQFEFAPMSAEFNLRGELLANEHERKVTRHVASELPPLIADTESALRAIWTRNGVPESRQNEIIADATAKAALGYMDRFFPASELPAFRARQKALEAA